MKKESLLEDTSLFGNYDIYIYVCVYIYIYIYIYIFVDIQTIPLSFLILTFGKKFHNS